jgi:flagellin-like hook-associated protein FlgL
MSRIGYTLSGIERQLLLNLSRSDAQIAMSTLRKATGHKINSPADNPSAFVQLSGLQSQLSNVSATLNNIQAAEGMVSQTQDGIASIQTQLGIIRTELLKDVNHTLTPDQRAAAQNTIDAAIKQINVLAGTRYDGKATLSGAGDFTYSGRDSSQVALVQVQQYSIPREQTIYGSVTSAATQAQLTYEGDLDDKVTSTATFTLTGTSGDQVITATAGDTLQSVADKVNNSSYTTGVTASVDTGNHHLIFTSVDYGSQAKAQIVVSSGSFITTGDTTGTNASGVINGQTISADSGQVSGNRFSVNDNGLVFDIQFTPGFTGTFNQITVSGSALTFALSTDLYRTSTLAIPGMYAPELGGASGTLDQLATGGSISGLDANTAQALRVVNESLGNVTRISGAVDGFYNSAITSASNLMTKLQTDLQKQIDTIDKTDDQAEDANIAHYQALADNAVSGLAILNYQQQAIVDMIRQIAGLTNYGPF